MDFKLSQASLLRGQCFGRCLVSAISGEPDAVADREDVVVRWNQVDVALATPEEAVLLVVADADYDAQQAAVVMLLMAQSAENRAGIELIYLGDTVFDVVRRRHVLHFQLALGATHFFAKSAQDGVAGSGISSAGGS